MKVTKWKDMLDWERPKHPGSPPACKNGRHNLFAKGWAVLPGDARSTISEYGIFEVRECTRCGRVQQRYKIPEGPIDADVLVKAVDDFNCWNSQGC